MVCGGGGDQTLLLAAAKQGDTATASRLLSDGADTESCDKNGKTALLRAAKHGNVEVCKVLLRGNANIYAISNDRRTLLHMAVLSGNERLVETLLASNGVSNLLDAQDGAGRTPAQLAEQQGKQGIKQILQSKKNQPAPRQPHIQADSTSAPAPPVPSAVQRSVVSQPAAQGASEGASVAPVRVPAVPVKAAPHAGPPASPKHGGPLSARHAGPPEVPAGTSAGAMRVPLPSGMPSPAPATELVSPPNLRPINTQPRKAGPRTVPMPGAQPRVVPAIPVAAPPKGPPARPAQGPVRVVPQRPLTPTNAAVPLPGRATRAPATGSTPHIPGTPQGPAHGAAPPGTPGALFLTPRAGPATPLGGAVAAGATPRTPLPTPDGALGVPRVPGTPGFPADVAADDDLDKETGKEYEFEDEDGQLIDDELVLEDQKAQAQAEYEATVVASLAAAHGDRRGRWTKVEVAPEDYLLIVTGALDLLDEIEADCENLTLSRNKCKHLAERVEGLRPILQALQAKLESGGPKALAPAGDAVRDVITDLYDVADDVQQHIHDWMSCTMGDFGMLVKALTREELNVDFTGLHGEVDDLLEVVAPMLEALRIPTDELPRSWEEAFEAADEADRDTLMSEALTIVKGSVDAAAAVHKLMFESAMSSEDLMLILMEHDIRADGLPEFTAVVEEAGALREAAWGSKQQQQQQEEGPGLHVGQDADEVDEAPRATPGPRYPVINPAAATPTEEEEFTDFQDAGEEFKNDADKC